LAITVTVVLFQLALLAVSVVYAAFQLAVLFCDANISDKSTPADNILPDVLIETPDIVFPKNAPLSALK